VRSRILIGCLVLAAIAAIAATFASRTPRLELASGTPLPAPRPGAQFQLIDQRGAKVSRDVFADRWTVLFLGFTHCPDVCPTTLAMLSAIHRELSSSGRRLQIVLLSADPQRDRPEVMARYLRSFDPAFIGLTGEEREVARLAASFGLGFVRNPGVDGDYTVDHSAGLVLIDPQARAVAYFRPPFAPEALLCDLSSVVPSER
jgi:protein SCO1/2